MPRKTRQELHEEYIQKIDKCERWREAEGFEQTWRRLNDLYRGKHWPATTSTKHDLLSLIHI